MLTVEMAQLAINLINRAQITGAEAEAVMRVRQAISEVAGKPLAPEADSAPEIGE
jgi:hypothetical protein